MTIEILMPALSPTMTEGSVVSWRKKEGDLVRAGEIIVEIETDKAVVEVEALNDGTLGKILLAAGSPPIPVNRPIALLLEHGESATELGAGAALGPVEAPAAPGLAPAIPAPLSGEARPFASPLARRLAAQGGLDLRQLEGSGPKGRVVKADVDAALAGGRRPGVGEYLTKLGMDYVAVPNSGMRKTIARRLTESKQTVPHFYLGIDCRLDALLGLRAEFNARPGAHYRLSINDFAIAAAALALKRVPQANAAWTEDAVLMFEHADISVAVATLGGLITPIVKQAEAKGLAQLSNEMKDLASRAREGRLQPEEFLGGSFSISNLGMYGVREFAAIINPPQACILALGAAEQRAVVKDGALAAATLMSCTLSVDHRAVDGATGARFLEAFRELIEDPSTLRL